METKKDKALLYGGLAVLGLVGVNAGIDLYNKFSKEEKTTAPPKKDSFFPGLDSQKIKKKNFTTKSKNIYKIVLTGGPCAGKTTALTTISDRLRERGFRVYCVPECASLVANGGGLINIMKMTRE